MKRTTLFKIASTALAILMTLSFAACSAAPNKNEMFGDENWSNNNGGMASGDPSNGVKPGDDAIAGVEQVKPEASPDITVGGADLEYGATEPEQNTGDPAGTEDTNGDPVEPSPPTVIDLLKNPFMNPANAPLSTFSADVDTASYTYFRKLVNMGYGFDQLRNGGSDFRIEEFINYFRYDVEQPREGELFGVKTEMVPCPWNAETLLFRITLQAEDAKPSAGNNLVFLIDVSGSMSGQDKLPLLKKAFSYLVGNLGANDTVSIVTYSGKEAIVLDGCDGLDSEAIMNAINSLKASGSTNGEAGLTMAYQIAEKHFIAGGNNRIIMASDGDLNVGISSKDELTQYIEQKRDQGVYLSVLGFGTGNYRDDRMEALADNGNGVYYYIDGENEAEKVFGTDLIGTLYTVANDVKLQVEFDPQLVEAYRLIGYDNRRLSAEDFENDAKDAGEVGASHQITVVYEIKPGQQTPGNDNDPITLRVRYKTPGHPLSQLNEYGIDGIWKPAEPSDDMVFITAVLQTAALLRNRDYAGDVTLEGIALSINGLTLNDSYKEEFREILGTLILRQSYKNSELDY